MNKGGVEGQIIVLAPLLKSLQTIEFQYAWAFIPLRIQEHRIHFLGLYIVEDSQIGFFCSRRQRRHDLVRIDVHHADWHFVQMLSAALRCRVRRYQMDHVADIEEGFDHAEHFVGPGAFVVPGPATDEVEDIHYRINYDYIKCWGFLV